MITRHFMHCLALLTLLSPAVAAPPLWWSDGIPPVIDTNATANNHGPANIGQAKWMVSEALRALDATDPAIASQVRADLAGSPPDYTDRLIDLSVPPEDPKPDDWVAKQKAPLLIGQLKAISSPFYTRLAAANPTWLARERTTNGTNSPGSFFPWTSSPDDDSNKAIATIGQLKAVFSLRFEGLPAIPEWWQRCYFNQIGLDPSTISERGGLTYLQCYLQGLSPLLPTEAPALEITEMSYSIIQMVSLSPSIVAQMNYTLDSSNPIYSPTRVPVLVQTTLSFTDSTTIMAVNSNPQRGESSVSSLDVVVTSDEKDFNFLNRRPRYLLRPAR